MARRDHARVDTTSATVVWAIESTSESDQAILRCLSAFGGAFSMPAAKAACGSDEIDPTDVAEGVRSLAQRGLMAESDEAGRYRLSGPVRAHARTLAERAGESDLLRRRHAQYFGTCARQELQAAAGDVDRALEWATEHDAEVGLRLATNASELWHDRGEWARTARWLDALTAKRDGVAVGLLAAALTARSRARLELSDPAGALRDADDALAHASSLDDRGGVALARRAKGQALVSTGSAEEGMRYCEEALASLRRLDRHEEAAVTAAELAAASMLAGDAEKAMAHAVGGLRAGAGEEASSALLLLRGIAAARSRDYAHAREALGEALVVHRRVGAGRHEASNLLWQAELAGREGDHHAAALYHSERLHVLRRVGTRLDVAQALRSAGVSSRRGGRVADARRVAREDERLRAELDQPQEAARARLLLVDIAVADRNATEARHALSHAMAGRLKDSERALCLEALATVAHLSELNGEAAVLLGAAATCRDEGDVGETDALESLYADAAAMARGELRRDMGDDAYDRATADGQAMTLDAAIAYGRERLAV
ncbi:hypothetical protein HN937_01525 [Candidatus Poribacteria bacterium]|nr:hypothetical protein [Candidatus Poribacteria bacterium]